MLMAFHDMKSTIDKDDFMSGSSESSIHRRIFVYSFCLIDICLSLSDDANKIKTLNIERAKQFKFSLKI